MLVAVLPPVSCLAWGDPTLRSIGSMTGLIVSSTRAYAKWDLPGLLLPVSPSLWWDPADPHLHRRPSTLTDSFGSVSCGLTAPSFWVLSRFLFVPSETGVSLFPLVLYEVPIIKPCWSSRSDTLYWDYQSLCQIHRLGSWQPLEPSTAVGEFF